MNNDFFPNYSHQQNNTNSNNRVVVPEAYIETNMFLNLGHFGIFHMSFPDSQEERDVVFEGIISEAVKDHFVIYNSNENLWYLLPYLYLNYAVFKDKPKLIIS